MKKERYNEFLNNADVYSKINKIKNNATILHDVTCNQKYGDNEPYSFHLNMVADFAMKYGYFVCYTEEHIIPIIFGAYFHDAIEDARVTYNDVMHIAKKYMDDSQALMATEIVYALTDEKGRTRAERGSDKHYEDIRNTLYAPFVKWCDRYANVMYSLKVNSRMAKTYEKEMMTFIEKLGGSKYLNDELCSMLINLVKN